MPSGELLRQCAAGFHSSAKAEGLEILLPGMPKPCVKALYNLRKVWAQTLSLYSASTAAQLKVLQNVCNIAYTTTASTQPNTAFWLPFLVKINPLSAFLYTLSTAPTNTTNLYKGFNL